MYVVRAPIVAELKTSRSAAVDEIPIGLDELAQVPAYGTELVLPLVVQRAQVLRDSTGSRSPRRYKRQARLDVGV